MRQILPPPLRRALLLGLLLMRSVVAAWAQSPYQVPLGQAATYGLLSGGTIVAQDASGNALPTQALGKAGASGAIGAGVAATAGVFAQGSGTVPAALSGLAAARSYCASQSSTAINADLSGRTLGGGSYAVAGNANLGSGGVLTLTGDTGTVVILNITGSLTVGSQARIKLVGILPHHVYWNLGGSLSVASQAGFWGVALLPVGTTATLTGIHYGTCTLLSGGSIMVTNISATIGHNKFYAPQKNTATCSPSLPCSYTRPGSELIRDGSIELRVCCPSAGSDLDFPSSACYWQSATAGSADYFHSCANPGGSLGVPSNALTQSPVSGGGNFPVAALAQNSPAPAGNAYAGIYACIPGFTDNREYIYQKLDGTLQPNRRYYAEFSAHLTPSSGVAATALGMLVEPASSSYPNAVPGRIAQTPTISGSAGGLPNSANRTWQRVGGVFTTGSTPLVNPHVIIGNFGDDTQIITPGGGGGGYAYYFIDNVTLSPVTEAGPSITTGDCKNGSNGASITLGTAPMPALVGATYAWTSSDGSLVSSQPNPTVAPWITTTYFLTVSIPGQPPYTSQATVTVLGSYTQNPGATYMSSMGAPYDIGMYGTVTTVDAYGGTVIFDGQYHVQGTVHLVNGTFELVPGTVFFVDGNSGLPFSSGYDTSQTGIVLLESKLHLDGATLQANCPGEQWDGVRPYGNSIVRTDASSTGIRSRIQDAAIGIKSQTSTEYYLTNTDFDNNSVGLYELAANKGAQPLEGARGCTFSNGDYGIILEGGDYGSGVVVGGDYRQASFKYNVFTNFTWMGLYATAGKAIFNTNTFSNCGWAGMGAWNTPQVGRAEFYGNTITVPASGTWQSQYGPDVFGVTGVFAQDPTLLLTSNIITGAPAPLSTTGTQRTGIHYIGNMDSGSYDQVAGNTISNLDQGLAGITNDYAGTTITVKKNTFTNNAAGVVFYPIGAGSGAPVTATIRCNSFINDANNTVSQPTGIWLKSGAFISGGLNGTGNGNEFSAAQWGPPTGATSLRNDNASSANRLFYTKLSTTNETISASSNVTVNTDLTTNPIGACGGTLPGVNSRQYAAAVTLLDSLQADNLTVAQQGRLLTGLRGQPVQAMQLPAIEELLYATRLSVTSRVAVGIYLFSYYREQHDWINVNRLRNWLGDNQPNDKGELAAYLHVTQALDQMGSFLPGFRPLDEANRQLLQQVAISGTASARLACQLLRAYEPTCACLLPAENRPVSSARLATAPHARLAAYPNPASTVLHVPYTLPAGTSEAELLAYDALGRIMLRQIISGQQLEIEISTHAWPIGLYQLALVAGGRVLRTQRVAVTSH